MNTAIKKKQRNKQITKILPIQLPIQNADITNANTNEQIQNADIANADITNADITNADIANADIANADITNADITNADIANADITNENEQIEQKPIDIFFGAVSNKPKSPIPFLTLKDIPLITANAISSSKAQINNKLISSKTQCFSNIDIKSKIEHFTENELQEIFKIIKNNKEKYSSNKNGIFVNLNTLKKCTLQEITKFIVFCDNNNSIFEEEEKLRNIYREMILEN